MRLKVSAIAISIILSHMAFAQTATIRAAEQKDAEARAAADAKFAKATGNWSAEKHKYEVKRLSQKTQEGEVAVAELDTRITEIKKEIALREKGEGRSFLGTNGLKIGLEKLEAERVAQVKENTALKSQISQHGNSVTTIANLNPKSLEVGLAKIEVKQLFLDSAQVKFLLDNAGMKIEQLYAQMDKTLLGQYSQYVADQAVKKFADKGLCEAVAKCSAVKSAAADVRQIKAEIKSFSLWKKELEQENVKPAATSPTGASGAP